MEYNREEILLEVFSFGRGDSQGLFGIPESDSGLRASKQSV